MQVHQVNKDNIILEGDTVELWNKTEKVAIATVFSKDPTKTCHFKIAGANNWIVSIKDALVPNAELFDVGDHGSTVGEAINGFTLWPFRYIMSYHN